MNRTHPIALLLLLGGCAASEATLDAGSGRDASALLDDGSRADAPALDDAAAPLDDAAAALDAAPRSDASAPPPERIWAPGHYLIVNTAESGAADMTASAVTDLLADPDAARFSGVHVKFLWRTFETAEGVYDFSILDDVIEVAAAHTCTAGDGTSAPCRVVVQFQYKTPDPSVAPIPDYMLGGGLYCAQVGTHCGIPDDPSARTAAQRGYCSPVDTSHCGVHEFAPPSTGGGGESLAMLWLPAIEARFQAMLGAAIAHLAARADGDTVSALALPETTFEWDPDTLTAEAYDRDTYEAALRRDMLFARDTDPTRVTFQYVGNLPPILRSTPDAWSDMVHGFYDFASGEEGLGIGHPDVAPLLGPLNPARDFTVNPAVLTMMDPAYFGIVPRNPNIQSPDIQPDRTPSFDASYDLVVNGVRGNYIAWTTSRRDTPVFDWHTVAAYLATHPLPAANLARPTW
jgi:hypothetical protein